MGAFERGLGYELVPLSDEDMGTQEPQYGRRARSFYRPRLMAICAGMIFVIVIILVYFSIATGALGSRAVSCDTVIDGYQCEPEISHYWGQYSPYFSVPSEISADIPEGCEVTFAQILSRHGARDPTAAKTVEYDAVINKIQTNVQQYEREYAFLKDYAYRLGADQLSVFGQQELVNSGIKFYDRYKTLAKDFIPFVRASGQERVVQSGQNFTQGFHQAWLENGGSSHHDTYPYPIIIIPEKNGSNNTLDHGRCKTFEEDPEYDVGSKAQKKWVEKFTPPIVARLNANLPGANLTTHDAIHFMDLCPFETVASPAGKISPFCNLFTIQEWHQFDYYQSLGKYYGFGNGNPLGPTQGVGFANELIARMTQRPVDDHTSVNHTLDDSNTTFPVGQEAVLFADFSHDNDLTSAFSALGLYNSTALLSNTTMHMPEEMNGYSVAWTVPFAGRAYIEKMKCNWYHEELIRIIVNDRVRPLETCGGDSLGRCTLKKFVESLSFARSGGHWDQCFT